MPAAKDMDLLREFARHNSEAAFAELVCRHLNLVYSMALRFTSNPGDAEDVTQAVFIILRPQSRTAGRMHRTGWLYETTRLTAAGWLRSQPQAGGLLCRSPSDASRRLRWGNRPTNTSTLNG